MPKSKPNSSYAYYSTQSSIQPISYEALPLPFRPSNSKLQDQFLAERLFHMDRSGANPEIEHAAWPTLGVQHLVANQTNESSVGFHLLFQKPTASIFQPSVERISLRSWQNENINLFFDYKQKRFVVSNTRNFIKTYPKTIKITSCSNIISTLNLPHFTYFQFKNSSRKFISFVVKVNLMDLSFRSWWKRSKKKLDSFNFRISLRTKCSALKKM